MYDNFRFSESKERHLWCSPRSYKSYIMQDFEYMFKELSTFKPLNGLSSFYPVSTKMITQTNSHGIPIHRAPQIYGSEGGVI